MYSDIIKLIPEDGEKTRMLDGQKVGDFTGRCFNCGSTNQWDDETAYGCNDCEYIRTTGELTKQNRS
jgi:hypothetical protein